MVDTIDLSRRSYFQYTRKSIRLIWQKKNLGHSNNQWVRWVTVIPVQMSHVVGKWAFEYSVYF